jgi:hypothetical protein
MGSLERSIRRKKEKTEKKRLKKEINQKMQLNSLLPEGCLTCDKPFDKTDKEMIDSWYMIVRDNQQAVNLYCPACWEDIQKEIKEFASESRD